MFEQLVPEWITFGNYHDNIKRAAKIRANSNFTGAIGFVDGSYINVF